MRQQFGFPKGLPGTRDKRKKKKNSRRAQSGADWGIAAVYSPELVRTAQDNGQGGREGEQAASFRACDVAFGARASHTELSIYLSIHPSIHPSIYLWSDSPSACRFWCTCVTHRAPYALSRAPSDFGIRDSEG